MDFLKQNKVAIGVGVLLIVGLFVYMTYFSSSPAATLTASDSSTTISQNLLITLQNLHTIKLDNSIFSDPSFQSLTDFGVTIPAESVGRRDPFLPLSGSTSGGSSIAVPTLPATH
jgi:hypothetical protein